MLQFPTDAAPVSLETIPTILYGMLSAIHKCLVIGNVEIREMYMCAIRKVSPNDCFVISKGNGTE